MRHLYGTALAIIMTAVLFFAGAWGYLRLLKLPVPPGQTAALPAGGGSLLGNGTVLLAIAAVVGTAVLAGVLVAVPWFSPLAAGLPGLLLLAWTGLFLLSVRRAVDYIPLRSHAFGAGWEGLLFSGILGAAGAVMIFPMFVPSRWRRPRRPADVEPDRHLDEYLSTVTADSRPSQSENRQPVSRQPEERQPVNRQPEEQQPEGQPWEDRPQEEQPPLVGTVMFRPATTLRPVDTTRVTGASRALRATGSFRATTGAFRAANRPTPRDGEPRVTRDAGLPGHPYQREE